QSLCYSMLEILNYIKPLIDENKDVSANQSKWQIINSNETISHGNWVSGTVIRIADNGYGTFKDEANSPTLSIMPSMVKEYDLDKDQKIEVMTKPSSDGSKTYIEKIKTL